MTDSLSVNLPPRVVETSIKLAKGGVQALQGTLGLSIVFFFIVLMGQVRLSARKFPSVDSGVRLDVVAWASS